MDAFGKSIHVCLHFHVCPLSGIFMDGIMYLSIPNADEIHDKYVVDPADMATENIGFVCKSHYIDCLINEF
jgi:hypothetical protein